MLTDFEMNRIDKLHDDIDLALVGADSHLCLHALCAALAGHAVRVVKDNRASKQLFISEVVGCFDDWFAYYNEIIEDDKS